MIVLVHTSTGRVLRGYCCNSMDVVRMLMALADNGIKCVRWVVERVD